MFLFYSPDVFFGFGIYFDGVVLFNEKRNWDLGAGFQNGHFGAGLGPITLEARRGFGDSKLYFNRQDDINDFSVKNNCFNDLVRFQEFGLSADLLRTQIESLAGVLNFREKIAFSMGIKKFRFYFFNFSFFKPFAGMKGAGKDGAGNQVFYLCLDR